MSRWSRDNLDEAKRRVNLATLIRELYPQADLKGLKDEGKSTIKDPRTGERTGSFSVYRDQHEIWRFKRHDGDHVEPDGDAITLLMDALGLTVREAIVDLLRRAGLKKSNSRPKNVVRSRVNSEAHTSKLEVLRTRQAKQLQLPSQETLDALVLVDHELAPSSSQYLQLQARGLLDAAMAGRFSTYFWQPDAASRKPRGMPLDAVITAIKDSTGKVITFRYRAWRKDQDAEATTHDWQGKYRPIGSPGGSPPWISAPLDGADIVTEWIIEGEYNAASVQEGLLAAHQTSFVVQGVTGSSNWPAVKHDFAGRAIYVYTDEPKDARKWADVLIEGGARVYQLPYDTFGVGGQADDANDALVKEGAEALGRRLLAAAQSCVEMSPSETPAKDEEGAFDHPYFEVGHRTFMSLKSARGEVSTVPLADFTARITNQTKYVSRDGTESYSYTIEGTTSTGHRLPPIQVTAEDYPKMMWVVRWGYHAHVHPGHQTQNRLRSAIQVLSADVTESTVYRFTGWVNVAGEPTYVLPGHSITVKGRNTQVRADLHHLGGLEAYDLPEPGTRDGVATALRASLDLAALGADAVLLPLLASTYRSVLGIPHYVVLLVGSSGLGKTNLLALMQAHFGPTWSATNLPGTWRSTATSIRELSAGIGHTLFVVDDFKPSGHVREDQSQRAALSSVIEAVGDHAGRQRSNRDASKVTTGGQPRSTIMISGESVLLRHSDVARAVHLRFTDHLLKNHAAVTALTEAQSRAAEGVYAQAMSGFIQYVAAHYKELVGSAFAKRIRTPLRTAMLGLSPHARMIDNAADLCAGWQVLLTFALHSGALTLSECQEQWQRMLRILPSLLDDQNEDLGTSDPVQMFIRTLGAMLSAGTVYLANADDDKVPHFMPERWGWRSDGESGDVRWEPVGRPETRIGWLKFLDKQGEHYMLLDPQSTYDAVKKRLEASHTPLPPADMLWRQLKARYHSATNERMLCEGGKTTYRREYYGSSGRRAMLTLRHDVIDQGGDTGTAGTESEQLALLRSLSFVPVVTSDGGTEARSSGTPLGTATIEAAPESDRTSERATSEPVDHSDQEERPYIRKIL